MSDNSVTHNGKQDVQTPLQSSLSGQHVLRPQAGGSVQNLKRAKNIDEEKETDHQTKNAKLNPISPNDLEAHPTSVGLKSSTHGDVYQLKLLMLFLHRGIENKYKFKLATEREGVGAFDDVFFEYDKNKRSCLQAKHKLNKAEEKIKYSKLFPTGKKRNETKGDKGEFLIKKYFISYLEADLKFKKLEHLIICTNIDFDFKGEEKKLKHPHEEKYLLFDEIKIDTQQKEEKYKLLKEILTVGSSKKEPKFYRFGVAVSESDVKKEEILKMLDFKPEDMPGPGDKGEKFNKLRRDLQDAEIDIEAEKSNFLDKLVFAVNQPDEKELGERIKAEVGSKFKLTDSDLLYDNFQATMLNWFNEKEGTYHTDESGKEFFEEAKQKLAKLILIGPTLEYRAKISHFGIEFAQDITQELQLHDFLAPENQRQIFNLITQHNMLSAIKAYQVLQGTHRYKNDDSYIFMRLSSLLRIQDRVMQAFSSETSHHLLVIECKEDRSIEKKEIEILFNRLSDIINSNSNKKIILVTKEDDALANLLKAKHFDRYNGKKDEKNSFTYLNAESQKKLLEESKIVFQGYEINLGKLLHVEDKSAKENIDSETLSKLINNKEIKIGNILEDLVNVKHYYIDRTFNRKINIKDECLKDQDVSDIFAVSNIGESEFSKLVAEGARIRKFEDNDSDDRPVEFIILNDLNAANQFKQLCNKNPDKNIHWLKKEESKLVWQQSQNSLSRLREYIDNIQSSTKQYNEKEFIDEKNNNKVIIIAAEPGMGKSTVLTSLSKKIKNDYPSLWIIRVNLNNYTENLSNLNFDDKDINEPENITKAINFLLTISNHKTSLENNILRHRLKSQGGVALLFDGFDEISPKYENKAIQLLKVLKSTKSEKIWITTRPYMRNGLENSLSIFSYTLEPFSRSNQEVFLRKFWSKDLSAGKVNKQRLETYIKKSLDLVSGSIRDKEAEFTGIPLQTRVLAEIFQEEFEFYNSNKDNPDLPDKLDLVNLYQDVVNKKYYEIYCKEQSTTAVAEENYDELYPTFIQKHQKLALYALFTAGLEKLLSKQKIDEIKSLIGEIEKGKEKKGIVDQVVENKPRFIHRSFAEYFAAQWFSDVLNNKQAESVKLKKVLEFLKEWIFRADSDVIRSFLDRKLVAELPIHSAALKGDKEEINKLLPNDNDEAIYELGKKDKLGRIPLHLAILYGHKEVVQLLIQRDSESISVFDFLSTGSLGYAVISNNSNMLSLLLHNENSSCQKQKMLNDAVIKVAQNCDSILWPLYTLLENTTQEQRLEMFRADNYYVLKQAVQKRNLKMLATILGIGSVKQRQEMFQNFNYVETFKQAFQRRDSSMLETLLEHAPEGQRLKMFKADNYYAIKQTVQNSDTIQFYNRKMLETLLRYATEWQRLEMFRNFDYIETFKKAVQINGRSMLYTLLRYAPAEQRSEMFKAYDYYALKQAVQNSDRSMLYTFLRNATEKQRLELLRAGDYYALKQAVQNSDCSMLKIIMQYIPEKQHLEMFQNFDYVEALKQAFQNSDRELLDMLLEKATGIQRLEMFKADGYYILKQAVQNSDNSMLYASVLHKLPEKTTQEQRLEMLKADDYYALKQAVQDSDCSMLRIILQYIPEKQHLEMFQNFDYIEALKQAFQNSDRNLVDMLLKKATEKQRLEMLKVDDYYAIKQAAQKSHSSMLTIMLGYIPKKQHLEVFKNFDYIKTLKQAVHDNDSEMLGTLLENATKEQRLEMFRADNYYAIKQAVRNSNDWLLRTLLRYATKEQRLEMFQNFDYIDAIKQTAQKSNDWMLRTLLEKSTEEQRLEMFRTDNYYAVKQAVQKSNEWMLRTLLEKATEEQRLEMFRADNYYAIKQAVQNSDRSTLYTLLSYTPAGQHQEMLKVLSQLGISNEPESQSQSYYQNIIDLLNAQSGLSRQ